MCRWVRRRWPQTWPGLEGTGRGRSLATAMEKYQVRRSRSVRLAIAGAGGTGDVCQAHQLTVDAWRSREEGQRGSERVAEGAG